MKYHLIWNQANPGLIAGIEFQQTGFRLSKVPKDGIFSLLACSAASAVGVGTAEVHAQGVLGSLFIFFFNFLLFLLMNW